MGWVLRIILLVFLILFIVYAVRRWPAVHYYSSCYQTAYQQYDEKGLIIKRAGVQGESLVCQEKKAFLLNGLTCLSKAKSFYPLEPSEQKWMERVGRWLRFGVKDFQTMIAEHNQTCPEQPNNLRFDIRTQTWF